MSPEKRRAVDEAIEHSKVWARMTEVEKLEEVNRVLKWIQDIKERTRSH